jgi:hypothetical protein
MMILPVYASSTSVFGRELNQLCLDQHRTIKTRLATRRAVNLAAKLSLSPIQQERDDGRNALVPSVCVGNISAPSKIFAIMAIQRQDRQQAILGSGNPLSGRPQMTSVLNLTNAIMVTNSDIHVDNGDVIIQKETVHHGVAQVLETSK